MIKKSSGLVIALLALLAGARGAQAADKACVPGTPPDGILRPIINTHTTPPYPRLSQQLGEQGNSTLRVDIGADGVPTDVSVSKTSGSERLDEAAEKFVKENWKWQPPLKDCAPVKSATLVTIVWHLRDPSPAIVYLDMRAVDFPPGAVAKSEQGYSIILQVVLPSGALGPTTLASSSGYPDLDGAALQLVRSHRWAPAEMDGQPVGSIMQISVHWPTF